MKNAEWKWIEIPPEKRAWQTAERQDLHIDGMLVGSVRKEYGSDVWHATHAASGKSVKCSAMFEARSCVEHQELLCPTPLPDGDGDDAPF